MVKKYTAIFKELQPYLSFWSYLFISFKLKYRSSDRYTIMFRTSHVSFQSFNFFNKHTKSAKHIFEVSKRAKHFGAIPRQGRTISLIWLLHHYSSNVIINFLLWSFNIQQSKLCIPNLPHPHGHRLGPATVARVIPPHIFQSKCLSKNPREQAVENPSLKALESCGNYSKQLLVSKTDLVSSNGELLCYTTEIASIKQCE